MPQKEASIIWTLFLSISVYIGHMEFSVFTSDGEITTQYPNQSLSATVSTDIQTLLMVNPT